MRNHEEGVLAFGHFIEEDVCPEEREQAFRPNLEDCRNVDFLVVRFRNFPGGYTYLSHPS